MIATQQLEIRRAVTDDQVRRQPLNERHDHLHEHLALRRIAEVDHRRYGCSAGPVEDIGCEHDEPLRGNAVRHALDLRAQSKRVHDQEHGRMALAVIGS